jgi:hypothetical protein
MQAPKGRKMTAMGNAHRQDANAHQQDASTVTTKPNGTIFTI